MRILAVTNYYPPYYVGGYELGCRDVLNKLIDRNHEVHVLTSTYGTEAGTPANEPHVTRKLNLNPRGLAQLRELQTFWRTFRRFRPDVVYFWNQSGLSPWLAGFAQLAGLPSCFFISDTAFVSWRIAAFLSDHRQAHSKEAHSKRFKSALAKVFQGTILTEGHPILHGRPCHFASAFLQQLAQGSGIRFDSSKSVTAHWGIEKGLFAPPEPNFRSWPPRHLLYVGQLIPAKGVHTCIEALAVLRKAQPSLDLCLSIVGGSTNAEYAQSLPLLARELGVDNKVQFLGKIPREEIPAIYQRHDILIFPSIWDEPFAITPLEAMACGLPVVGTTTGGSSELFIDQATAMVFQAGDARSCANAIAKICLDRGLYELVATAGQSKVHSAYTMDGMVDRVERSLAQATR